MPELYMLEQANEILVQEIYGSGMAGSFLDVDLYFTQIVNGLTGFSKGMQKMHDIVYVIVYM